MPSRCSRNVREGLAHGTVGGGPHLRARCALIQSTVFIKAAENEEMESGILVAAGCIFAPSVEAPEYGFGSLFD